MVPVDFELPVDVREQAARTREFGLLRAVGATTDQVRRVVRYESVITTVIGGLLGTVVGIAFAWLTTRALSEWDVSFRVPPGSSA